ncbi:hypothetical protein ACJMK2_028981 [Sinanodonta woodiana]|uniref:Nuclear pore complex protein Nup205 n=1 Tax=Sinanodonta woodiana TaxID=1069815 RepID=A0ABD3XB18_SINWO
MCNHCSSTTEMAVSLSPRTWTPYKELQEIVEAAIHKKQPDAVHDLEVALQKHKPDFLSLLKTPAKNAAFRDLVRKSKTEGIPIHGQQGTQTFSEDFIQEALIISDLFELNEFAALELLIAGEDEKPSYPGLTRGLLAVLLFYDGRKSLVLALRTLMQSLTGRTWTLELSPELSELTNTYILQLIDGKLTDRILEVISKMDLTLEMDKLQNNRALGSIKYKRQVQDIYMEIKTSLAECLFCLSCQRGLSKDDTLRLLAYLRKDNCLEADGSISPVSLHLLMALLFAFDVSILELEDAEEMAQELAVCKDPGFVAEIHKELTSDTPWAVPGLKAVAQFAWGLMLRQISQFPVAADVGDSCEEDEMLIDTAIDNQVFLFLHNSVLTAKDFHQEEFHLRRLHGLLTDFIYHMPLKVKDIRNRGDEAARIMLAHIQEGQEPPSTLKRDFEHLLNLLGRLYSKDPLHLELALEFWCPPEPNSTSFQDVYHYRPPQRQVALHKFVRMAGDLLPASLYVPYVTMLEGLATGPHCSQHCFNLLKINGGSASTVSWDHIFSSLGQYYTSLRREAPSSHDASHVYRAMYSRVITSQELEGLLAIISLTRTIVSESESCRIALCENQQWSAIVVLFGLVTCSVPAPMKAELLRMLAALAKTPEIASNLWQTLEASQILVTIPSSGQQKGGIKVELDEIESRNEEYVITRAFLELLDTLTNIPIPAALGAGVRAAGFDPYLEFIRDDVFLKFGSRAYKNAGEKWEMAVSALQILKKLLQHHEIVPEDFVDQVVELQGVGTMPINKPPGHVLMVYMLRDTELFSQILKILDDGIKLLELYSHIPGQSSLEKACLLCLQMIECALEKEDQFVNMIRNTGANIMVTSMDKMLLGINPRSLKADNLVNIAKYVMFNSTLPNQSLSAVRILYLVCKSASVQRVMVNLFTENQATKVDLLHGFVECLEQDDVEPVEMNLDLMSEKRDEDLVPSQLRNLTRQHLLKLLLYSLEQSAPNLAHFLLGFEIRKPVSKTTLQDAGVLNSPKTCLHAILTMLNRGAGSGSGPNCLRETPVLAELCYQLIYYLAANKDTSLPTLRYLRTSHDFLFRQIQHLPFDSAEIGHNVTNHQSWLLKTLAVELRLTSLNRQRSHTQRLMKLLLDDKDADETEVLQVVASENPELPSSSRYGDQSMFHTSQYGRRVIGQQSRRKLMRLLDSLEFTQEYPDQLDLEFFEPHMIQQVLASVEGKTEQGICYYNVKTLHRILMNELNNLPGTTMAGQRTHIQEEIESILRIVVARNNVSLSLHSKRQAFDAWRHVTEVILSSCPEDLLAGEARQSLLFELLQDLLLKISDENALSELTAPASGVLLTLIANLQHCFFSEDLESNGKEARSSQYTSQLERSQGTSLSGVSWGQGSGSRTLFATSLQITLKGLIEHLLRSSGRQQRVRVKLYGALLYYLQIVQRPKTPSGLSGDAASKSIESRLLATADTEYDHLKRENITTILSYGDKLMDLVCRDACDGLDVGRMLALSVLDTILTMDKFQQWQSFLSSKGYLQHLIDSIASDDSSLVDLLGFKLSILKSLYLFESKMSLLTRVAESAVGAYTLLHCGIMNRLASCTFFDMRPEVERLPSAGEEDEDDEFLPDIMSRYRRLLLATLKLCLAILTSLGIENVEAGMKVMQFVVAHGDVFHSILRDRQPSLNLQTLKELALTTAVLARANSQGDEASEFSEVDTAAIEFRGHRARIQRQMIALLPKYCLSERMNKQLKTLEGKETREKKNLKEEITIAFLEVATNVTTYCRAIVSNSGPSAQYCQILFGPSLEEAMSKDLRGSDEFSLSSLSPAQSPNLGVIVYQIKQCSNTFISVFDSHKQHLRKLEGLAELSSEDLKQFSGVATVEMSSQHRQLLAKKRLTQIIHYNYRQLQFLSYILENCLFLLWRHLEYYLIHCVPLEKQPSVYQGYIRRQQQMRRLQDVAGLSGSSRLPDQESTSETFEMEDQRKGVSQQEIETLKQTAVSVLNESLFKKVQEINQNFCKGRTHYGFVEAVNRRIKGLLRLHTGS